ncbi:MAG: gamma-glutamyltransferase, partial [Solirubrobacteraceae bacterium]
MSASGAQLGVVAAGHPVSAGAGADALRDGGNAVDAALAAMLASLTCEPLLTGLGAGGYMLVATPDGAATLLDFFVEAPGRGHPDPTRPAGELIPVSVSFGDAVQVFHVGAASVGTFGFPAGVCEAAARYARLGLERLVRPAAALAREGVELNPQQAYIVEILSGTVTSTAEAAAMFAPGGRLLRAGDRIRQPELGDALERLGSDGAAPFYTGDVGDAIADWLAPRGGLLSRADLAAYQVAEREPLRAAYRGREVLINPPPSAGGLLISRALAMLDARRPHGQRTAPTVAELVEVMERTQSERTPEFLAGLHDPQFVAGFRALPVGRLGSTTHVAALDRDGWACSVTCSNGSASGVIVPGTGVHLNNMLGEQDLNPTGWHRHPPGRRMPSMMAPAIVRRDGAPELVVGSAG